MYINVAAGSRTYHEEGVESMKDTNKAFLVKGAKFTKTTEMPIIQSCYVIPNSIIPFSHRKETKNFNQFVCFYEHDEKFECLWNNPRKYVEVLAAGKEEEKLAGQTR